jgi:hypothetical protein
MLTTEAQTLNIDSNGNDLNFKKAMTGNNSKD